MSVNVKQNGELVKVANNISIVQANWNETDDSKVACIRNKPETLKTINEINENTDENALAGASVIKELIETGAAGGGCDIVYLTQAEYDALPESKENDNIEYRITDASDDETARNIGYDNSTSGLNAINVQGAVDELSESLGEILTNYNLIEKTDCFDFSELTKDRAISFSYYKQNVANNPGGFGVLISYRVAEGNYLVYALTTIGVKYCHHNGGSGTWK